MNKRIPISPLSLNQLTRDYWGQYDPAVIAQLAELAYDPCYELKLYKAPSDDQEVFSGFQYRTYGMQVTPGSIIYGLYLPCVPVTDAPTESAPLAFTVQMTDVSLEHKFWDEPVSSLLLANYKPTFQSAVNTNQGSFPNLRCAPHPVVGSGLFDVEIQATPASASTVQRIELVFGVLEVCRAA
jgi:hypothetical protein